MTKIKKLNWESDFFNFNVGILDLLKNQFQPLHANLTQAFKLIVTNQKIEETIHFKTHELHYTETKRTYNKNIDIKTRLKPYSYIFDTDTNPCDYKGLLELAFESGKYSRFKCDTNFTSKQFESLYKTWIINSLNKQIADKIFYIKKENEIVGFASIKLNINIAQIGLIAVSANKQGQGLGSILLNVVENYCAQKKIQELNISTQKNNTQAGAFYEKNGYKIKQDLIIKHYWKTK
ncbi:MAG: GNAT family N-acetyltransferase [Flavobacteriaceae bacterium]|nr:GNAT family N-acetyltransferase [Flavobacteriaceae bacterium]